MLKKCPHCGRQYTKDALKMFETTVKAGFKINLTCVCGAAMVIDESQVPQSGKSPKAGSSPATPVAEKRWWQFWK